MPTPRIEMKPTPAEMLKFEPGQQQRPDAADRQHDHVGEHDGRVEQRAKRQVEQHHDQHQRQRTTIDQAVHRPPASAGTRRSTRRGRARGKCRSWLRCASATALARSRSRTLNLTAISRLPCSREMVEAPGRTKLPPRSGAPCSSSGVTRSRSRRRGTTAASVYVVLNELPVKRAAAGSCRAAPARRSTAAAADGAVGDHPVLDHVDGNVEDHVLVLAQAVRASES